MTSVFAITILVFLANDVLANSKSRIPIGYHGKVRVNGVVRDLGQEAKNKELVVDFYTKVFLERDLSDLDRYLSPNLTQHNPKLQDGLDGFTKFANSVFPPGTPPNPRLTIERIAAEGDYVWLHALNNIAQIANPIFDEAVVDIYRVQDDLIVEHFDVITILPTWSATAKPLMRTLNGQYQPSCGYVPSFAA